MKVRHFMDLVEMSEGELARYTVMRKLEKWGQTLFFNTTQIGEIQQSCV